MFIVKTIIKITVSYFLSCQTEALEIRDGGTEFSPSLGVFCSDKPRTLKSTGNVMYIKYYTNSNTPNAGFNAHVSTGTK